MKDVILKLLKEKPELLVELYPEYAKAMVGDALYKGQNYAGYHGAMSPQFKHGTVQGVSNAMPTPLNETSFFIDCALEAAVINATLFPVGSALSLIPSMGSNVTSKKTAFITGIGDDDVNPPAERTEECDPSPLVETSVDACAIEWEFGVRARQTPTGSMKSLLQKACDGLYSDFYFVGNNGFSGVRGVSDVPASLLTSSDRDLIVEGAVRRALSHLGRNQQKWLMAQTWIGDGQGDSGYKQIHGLLNMIRDDYGLGTNPLPITASSGTLSDCSVLNSCVIDANSECIGGGNFSIYEAMQEAESEVYHTASYMGLNPVDGFIFMHDILWSELVKYLPCEMIADSCGVGGAIQQTIELTVINGNDFEARQRLAREMRINLNGRTYQIVTDGNMPVTETQNGSAWEYEGEIVFVPFTVAGGEPVLTMEYLDYSKVLPMMGSDAQGLLNDAGLNGWSDGGRYHTIVKTLERCFQVDVEMCPRLCFTAPHLAWRIDNVKACTMKRRRAAVTNQFSGGVLVP